MSLRQKVRLELADGKVIETVYDGRDLRAWETKFKQSALAAPMSVSMLTYLGWSAAKRDGAINGQYDRYEIFDGECVDVRGLPLEEEGSPDPTGPDSDTPSAASDD